MPRQNPSTSFYSIYFVSYNNFIRRYSRNRNLLRTRAKHFTAISPQFILNCNIRFNHHPILSGYVFFASDINISLSIFLELVDIYQSLWRGDVNFKQRGTYVHVAAELDRSAFIIIFLAGLHARVLRSYSKIVRLNYESHRIRIKGTILQFPIQALTKQLSSKARRYTRRDRMRSLVDHFTE